MKKLFLLIVTAGLFIGFSSASLSQPQCRANQSIGVTTYCSDSKGTPPASGNILGLDRAYSYAALGQQQFKLGNIETAMRHFTNAKRYQRNGEASRAIFDGYMLVARYQFATGNYSAAVTAGQYATEQLPTNYQGYWLVAESYYMRGDKEKAKYYLQFVRKYAPLGGTVRNAVENVVKNRKI